MANAARLFSEAFETELLQLAEANPNPRDWSVAGKNRAKTRPNGEDATWWRANGPKMVQAWIDWRTKNRWPIWTTPDGQPGIELPVEVVIPGLSDELWMVIDRVFEHPSGDLIIVDLKTGSRTPESDLQLGIYRYGLFRKYGVLADRGAYWMAREGQATEPIGLQRYTPELIEKWFRKFEQAKDAGIFLPHITFRCRACAMNKFCAAYGGPLQHMDPDTQVEGVTT